ncbi:hypothetical protein PI125_g19307 [Phytophthora idaei]|nr:hypothetical protein PI125_g19307 [Phytophthora idaei]
MAMLSGRLDARSLTVLHVRAESEAAVLEAGFTSGSFASDVSPTTALPRAEASWCSYDKNLDGIDMRYVMDYVCASAK